MFHMFHEIGWKRLAVVGALAATGALLGLEPALAMTAGEMGGHIAKQGENLGKVISMGCYLGGMGAAGIAAAEFIGHNKSPQQHPFSHGLKALGVCGMLLFLPQTFQNTGETFHGAGAAKNSPTGTTAIGGGGGTGGGGTGGI